jgi:hypothetical protein
MKMSLITPGNLYQKDQLIFLFDFRLFAKPAGAWPQIQPRAHTPA